MRSGSNLVKNLRRRLSNAKSEDVSITSPREMEELPSLKSVTNVQKRLELLHQKLELCSELANFASQDPAEKAFVNNKRKALLDVVDFLNAGPARSKQESLSEELLVDLMTMVKANLFVSLPPQLVEFDPEEDEPWLDSTWPHKQVVYELLLRLVVSGDFPAKMGKKSGLVDQDFCTYIINLFESDDPRERDYLKTILHRIYGKFMTHRSFIRKQISYVFCEFMDNGKRRNGIAELLEILGSIINGFALPLKPEHIDFIKQSLVPLHKSPFLASFTSQLTYCITQYIEKDPSTGQIVLDKLVEYWPWSNSNKQVTFLNELEEVLELVPPAVLELSAHKLFPCLARCVSSTQFQVCERTLFLWNNEHIVGLFHLENHDLFVKHNFKNVYAALLRNVDASEPHWNAAVTTLSYNVIDIYKERYGLDPDLFSKHQADKDDAAAQRQARADRWAELEKTAKPAPA
jgi:serine/threonine-protein phosphatase 2A regulatory subunit B'